MRTVLAMLLVPAVLLPIACASQRAPDSVHYAIVTPTEIVADSGSADVDHLRALRSAANSDLLWFERGGVEYVVSDIATVAKATREVNQLNGAQRVLVRPDATQPGFVPVYRGGGTTASPVGSAIDPAPPVAASNSEEYAQQWQAETNSRLDDRLRAYTNATTRAADAARRLQRILDDAVTKGLAQPVG